MKPLTFAVVSVFVAVVGTLFMFLGIAALFAVLWFAWDWFGIWGIIVGIPVLCLLVVFVEAYVVARFDISGKNGGSPRGTRHQHSRVLQARRWGRRFR